MIEDITLKERVAEVQGRIADGARRSGRSPDEVTLVAVTKTYPAEAVAAVARLGTADVGENRVQEALTKIEELRELPLPVPLRWHLIGHLQSNKAKQAVQHFDLIHSVDSLDLAVELNRQAERSDKVQRILLQANVSGEESKFGLSPADVTGVVEAVLGTCPAIEVAGYMTMAPFVDDAELARPHFAALRVLREEQGIRFGGADRYHGAHLSMGMTNDYEVAIEEGATLVRIGSAIFGAR